ncbi:MAG: tetratricopeptide repeat protein [Planctomycetaceae bacterium]
MNPQLDRAVLLLQQSRPELAERELRQALLSDPNDPLAHAILSLTLAEQDKLSPATDEAQAAIAAGPDLALGHHALSVVLRRRNRLGEARVAASEAIRLDPENEDHWAELAQIELGERRWQAALDAAEHGLAIDPEHAACNNLRAIALVKLGRRDEAGATIDAALARNPDDAVTHANQGWTLLHAGEPRKAMEHFRESLRLDPTSDWAKAGIVEAMKARNPLYRWLLAYFLWASALDRRVLFGLVIGAWFGMQFLQGVGDKHPAARPYILPVLIAYVVFCLSTWLGAPLANLLLRFDRFGRYALSRDQVMGSNLIGVTLVAAVGCLVAGLILQGDAGTAMQICAIRFVLLMMPVAAIHNCPKGWPRWSAALISGMIAFWATLYVVITIVLILGTVPLPPPLLRTGGCFLITVVLSLFAGNALMAATVRR